MNWLVAAALAVPWVLTPVLFFVFERRDRRQHSLREAHRDAVVLGVLVHLAEQKAQRDSGKKS